MTVCHKANMEGLGYRDVASLAMSQLQTCLGAGSE